MARPGVAVLSLARSERRNALSIDLLRRLVQELERLAADRAARVVILRAEGPVFSAGLDLAEAADPERAGESARCVAAALHALRHSPLVSIAAVHGGAYAGGAGVVAACDMAVGADDLKIGFPEAQRGLLPALIAEALRSKVREGDLAELFLVGTAVDAHRARERVVPAGRLLEEALLMADGVLKGGPQTIVDTKSLLRRMYGHETDASGASSVAMEAASEAIREHLEARHSPEAAEGLRAFLEKRPPRWTVEGGW
ncbi:MAG: enoyl-CoA hydratase/isomerase family protein [Planctomycetia bacterium]|nr:enoyl-CoA hydratase/isomerase family protein [Planctomycetia bacterium]